MNFSKKKNKVEIQAIKPATGAYKNDH